MYAEEAGILFKINTVVTALNKKEDMSAFINELKPFRWKVFQVLGIEGENKGKNINKVDKLEISSKEFEEYINRNRGGLNNKDILVPESNKLMRSSYILIDEYGRFLDCSMGFKTPTKSILEVGLENAIQELISSEEGGFHRDLFELRGGYYPDKWTKRL